MDYVIDDYKKLNTETKAVDFSKYFGVSNSTRNAWNSKKFNIRKPYYIMANLLYHSKIKVDQALDSNVIDSLEKLKEFKKEVSGYISHKQFCKLLGIDGIQTIQGWTTRNSCPKIYLNLANVFATQKDFYMEVFDFISKSDKFSNIGEQDV